MSEATAWARSLLAGLHAAGVREVVVSPGSRSTPLVFAAAEHGGFRLHSAIDERAAAFFALGQARVTGAPSAVICTSGTAGAHYYPAVIEASMARVPLVMLTADRPPELQACAAPQTMDQHRLFGTYVRAFHDLGLPNGFEVAHAAVRRRAVQAVHQARCPIPGPVHINVPARKPLEPAPGEAGAPVSTAPTVIRPRHRPDADDLHAVAERLAGAERPLIVAGPAPLSQSSLRDALAELARRSGAAVYAEATSQLRFGAAWTGDALGVLLGAPSFAARFAPDLVVQLGPPVTAGAYHRWRAARPEVAQIAVAPHDWPDPSQRAQTWVVAEPADVVPALVDALPASAAGAPTDWVRRTADWDADAWAAVSARTPDTSEGAAMRIIREAAPPGSLLVVGNSLPVRHLDAFCPSGGSALGVLSQRGVNGIDGLVAGAAGAASVAGTAVTLVLGDVSFSHDAGALALARRAGAPLVIVVLDNGGGRIFETLPAGRTYGDAPVFEHFLTPPPVEAATLAAAYGLRSSKISGPGALAGALSEAYARDEASVVQVELPPHGAVGVGDAIGADLDARFEGGRSS